MLLKYYYFKNIYFLFTTVKILSILYCESDKEATNPSK